MNATHIRPLQKEGVYQNKRTDRLPRQSSLSVRNPVHASTLRQTEPLSRVTNPWLVLTALGLGAFMALLDTSIVNITLSTIQTELHIDLATVSWILHIYNLIFAAFLITAGRLGDLFGRKRFVLIGLLLFTVGSVACGLSPSIFWLLGARALQASGAALLSAISLALVHTVFPKEKRGLAMSIFGTLNAVGYAAGPVIGGELLPLFGWRSVFLVNVPFCVVAFLLVILFVPEIRDSFGKKRLDVFGLVTLSLALFSLIFAFIKGSDWGWISPQILSLCGWAIIGFVLFVFIELRHPAPILDMKLFCSPHFSLASISTFLYSMATQGGNLFLSLYFLNARGETQFATALAILPVALAAFIIPNILSRMNRFITPWLRCMLGMCLVALGLLLFCTLTMHSTYLDTMWREVLFGTGIGLCLGSFPVVALEDVPAEKLGTASGTLNTFRQVGLVIGIALLIGIFSGQLRGNVQTAQADTMSMVQTDSRLPVELRDAIISQFFTSEMQNPPSENDLAQMTDDHPSWQIYRGELAVLSQQIEQAFDMRIVHAYTSTWALAAVFPMIGIGFVVALLIVSRKRSSPENAPGAVWSAFYFFSLSGSITSKTIHSYLATQQPTFLIQPEKLLLHRDVRQCIPVQNGFLAFA